MCGTEGSWYLQPTLPPLLWEPYERRVGRRERGPHTESHTDFFCAGDWRMGRVNSPGAGRQNHRLSAISFFFIEFQRRRKEYCEAEVVLRMAKRGGSAKKEWERFWLLCWRNEGLNSAILWAGLDFQCLGKEVDLDDKTFFFFIGCLLLEVVGKRKPKEGIAWMIEDSSSINQSKAQRG